MVAKRNYAKEYAEYGGTELQKKNRAARNHARRVLEREGKVHKGDGKDVNHRDGNPRNNDKSNWQIESVHANRSFKRKGLSGARQH